MKIKYIKIKTNLHFRQCHDVIGFYFYLSLDEKVNQPKEGHQG